jgi:hypothetical protein
MVGVIHTLRQAPWPSPPGQAWSRNLAYYPHILYLIPTGGLSANQLTWLPAYHNFLLPVKTLSKIFKDKKPLLPTPSYRMIENRSGSSTANGSVTATLL